jgi:SAM-dependent methyltransferase
MDDGPTNYLYRNPALYDLVFRTAPTASRLTGMVAGLLERNGKLPPATVLDIGCGTGFKLAHLQELGYRCTGVDHLESMASYAARTHPQLDISVGDIRTVRLGRTFDVLTALGWVIENVHSHADISAAMATFAAHARPGTLLVFDAHNAIGDLHAQGSRSEFAIERPGFTATGKATFSVDRRRQILTRHRTWELSDGTREADLARFRLYFPMELEHHLELHGFQVVEMLDNTDMRESDLTGSMLYVTATYRGGAA